MPPSPDDLPLAVAKLAAESGISRTTLYNWSRLPDRPLASVPGPRRMHTWAQLYEFVAQHPERYKASTLPPRPASTTSGRKGTRSSRTAGLRDATADFAALVEALRSAETVARAHRIQLENLLTAYED